MLRAGSQRKGLLATHRQEANFKTVTAKDLAPAGPQGSETLSRVLLPLGGLSCPSPLRRKQSGETKQD